jgi:hypothetical protein
MRERRGLGPAEWTVATIAILLSACASHERPEPVRSVAPAPLAYSRDTASVLRLRAGLNVAALSCRGRGKTSVRGAYSTLLSRHRGLLAAAYQAEERRLGRANFDRQQTRIYNRFANQKSPQRFCETAARLASRANRMDSPSLASASRNMVSELETRLR